MSQVFTEPDPDRVSSSALRVAALAPTVRVLAVVAIVVGSLAIVGWLCSIGFLTNPVPAEPPVKFNNGLCFLLSGLSILVLAGNHNTSRNQLFATICATIVLLIGLSTGAEHLFHLNLGIDQLFVADLQENVRQYLPGRMSLNAAIYSSLIGFSLLLVDRRHRLCAQAQQWAAVAVWLMTTAAIIGYGYGFRALYSYSGENPLTFPSALAFYTLAIGAFLLRPHQGPAAIYSSPTVAGAIARGLGFAGMLLPGLALISGLNRRTDLDLFLVALLLFLGFPLAVWVAAQRLEKTEQARLRGEQVIRELNAALKTRVVELLETNVELEATRDAALEAVKVKSEFLGKISHELRTPLAGTIGMIQLVDVDGLSRDDRESLEMAEESALQLLNTINDLLDFSNLDSGTTQLSERNFSVADVVAGVAAAIEPVAAKKDICLVKELELPLPNVKGDDEKLRKILLHLASNAVKFTGTGGCILLRVSAADRLDNQLQLRFSVADTGIGIAPEERKNLFHPFSQADNSNTRRYGGVGLGLMITKNLIELMGGGLGFSSIQGKGSTFWCTIPFLLSEAPPATPPARTVTLEHVHARSPQEARCSHCDFVPISDSSAILVLQDQDMMSARD